MASYRIVSLQKIKWLIGIILIDEESIKVVLNMKLQLM